MATHRDHTKHQLSSYAREAWKTGVRDRWQRSNVAVLDIETTGLSPETDHVWEFAVVALDGSRELHRRVAVPIEMEGRVPDHPSDGPTVAVVDALVELEEFLGTFKAVAGHNIAGFDLPFLEATAARSAAGSWSSPPVVLDLMELSLVDEPAAGRSLGELCQVKGVAHDQPHRALGDVHATVSVINRILDGIDTSDSSWRLAIGCLEAGAHGWAKLMPAVAPIAELEDGLYPAPDPLCRADGASPVAIRTRALSPKTIGLTAAAGAVFDGIERLADAGLRTRPGQQEMMHVVADTLDEHRLLAIEAPTGTGKTIGYLVPAAGHVGDGRNPVIVATATKVLQQQLRREAQRLRDLGILRAPFRQLQGVGNYVCTRELADGLDEGVHGPQEWLALAVAVRALATTENGVWDDVNDFPIIRRSRRYAEIRWSLRTTPGDCERQQCRWAEQCPLMARLVDVDTKPGLISTNHALIAAWVRAGTAPSRLLEDLRSAVIFDEAHELEDTLTGGWTGALGTLEFVRVLRLLHGRRGLTRSLRQASSHIDHELPSFDELRDVVAALRESEVDLAHSARAYLHEFLGSRTSTVLTAAMVGGRPEFRSLIQAAGRVRGSVRALGGWIRQARGALDQAAVPGQPVNPVLRRARVRCTGMLGMLDEIDELLESLRSLPDPHRWVHLLEGERDLRVESADIRWRYLRVPVTIAHEFADELVPRFQSVTLTSATLTVDDRFEFLSHRLGVPIEPGAVEPDVFEGRRVASPFDYSQQSAVVLTSHLPMPVPSSEREFCEDMAADQVGFLSISGGKTMALFAARSRMEQVAEGVHGFAERLAARGVRVLVQGQAGRAEIERNFRDDPGTVVYGLRSYWQGFDAPGETLSYLFIEKPPYPHPDDPIVAARQRAIAEVGGDPFSEYVVPKTALLMAQGFGRLIRSETDRGVAFLCDRRLQNPTVANRMLLGTLPGPQLHYSDSRDDAWSFALRFVTGVEPDLSEAIATPLDEVSQLVESLRILPGEDPEEKLRRAADLIFGIAELQPEQLELMRAVLEGRDALGILPTGFGKSLCFQLPALLRPELGATVVVSPLIALIKDQVDQLRANKGLRTVHGITSRTTAAERLDVMRAIGTGRVRLLYVSPERLSHDPVLQRALAQQPIAALVVDEAHCISSWGHDFRPEFRQIPKAVAPLHRSARLGLTATATPRVREDITRSIELRDPVVVQRSTDRPNLRFRVQSFRDDRERARELLRIATHFQGRPGIVYVGRRATSEELAALLRRVGINARHYHGAMVPEQRDAVQEEFFDGLTSVIVATKAFGMGINKPDIAWVVHYDLPESLEGYTQESGRAARDRVISGECVLFFTGGDIRRRRKQLGRMADRRELDLAQRLLDSIRSCPTRGSSFVFSGEDMATDLGIDQDELNVILGWLEHSGMVERQLDCIARGHVTRGRREPADEAERHRFREWFMQRIKLQPDVRRALDFEKLRSESPNLDLDELERQLVDWSLERFITFTATQRWWRVSVHHADLQTDAYLRARDDWLSWERDRLGAMIHFAQQSAECRRTVIGRHFGDKTQPCRNDPDRLDCDVCSSEPPVWHELPLDRVPDPETLIDPELVLLQALSWTGRFSKGHYGETGLSAALLGNEVLANGVRIGDGLLSCPQFGALRYLHGGQRRLDRAKTDLMGKGLIERASVERDGRQYSTLRITEDGKRALGGTLV